MLITDHLLDPTGNHAGHHHAQRHEARTDGVMRSLIFPFREENQVHGVSRETEAIAELLDRHAGVHQENILRHRVSHIQIDQIGQRDRQSHRPKPLFQAMSRDGHTAQDAAQQERDHADRPIGETNLPGRKGQSAGVSRIQQKRRSQFHQLRLAQTIGQHEENRDTDARLAEKGDKRIAESP